MFEETRKRLSDFMKETGKSQRQISKEINLSTSVISQFLNGNYPGDNTEVAKTIERYLAVGKERLKSVPEPIFYEQLHNTKEVLFACSWAHRNNDMVLVCGDAGAGKSTALRHYTDNHAGVILVTANACTTTASAVLDLLCKAIGRQCPSRKAALMNTLIEQLSGSSRLIIIDEADHLSLEALQAVRNLNDTAGCGVLLSGNDKIWRQMLSPRRGYEFDQLRTRLVVRKLVSNAYEVEELEKIFPQLDQSSIGFLLRIAERESLRTAVKVYIVAAELATATSSRITLKYLRDVQKQMMGEAVI